MKVLLVEDEDPKREAVLSHIVREFPDFDVEIASSVRSALAKLKTNRFELLLLDMSLPTFDIEPGEPGGRPQGFGGYEVLRHLEMAEIGLPTLVITAYEAFPSSNGAPVGLDALKKDLSRDFPTLFRGLIQFDPIAGEWGYHFRTLVEQILRDDRNANFNS